MFLNIIYNTIIVFKLITLKAYQVSFLTYFATNIIFLFEKVCSDLIILQR